MTPLQSAAKALLAKMDAIQRSGVDPYIKATVIDDSMTLEKFRFPLWHREEMDLREALGG